MLKPLTFSLSLAVALGFCSVSMAGGLDDKLLDLWTGLASGWRLCHRPGRCGAGCDPHAAPRSTASASICRRSSRNLPEDVHTSQLRVGPEEEAQLLFSTAPCGDRGALWRLPGLSRPVRVGCSFWPGHRLLRRGQCRRLTVPASTPSRLPSPDPIAAAPAEMTPAIIPGEEAPPAPEVSTTRGGGLLLPTPAGN